MLVHSERGFFDFPFSSVQPLLNRFPYCIPICEYPKMVRFYFHLKSVFYSCMDCHDIRRVFSALLFPKPPLFLVIQGLLCIVSGKPTFFHVEDSPSLLPVSWPLFLHFVLFRHLFSLKFRQASLSFQGDFIVVCWASVMICYFARVSPPLSFLCFRQ